MNPFLPPGVGPAWRRSPVGAVPHGEAGGPSSTRIAPIVNRRQQKGSEHHADLIPIVNLPPHTSMSRTAKAVEAERTLAAAAIRQAEKDAEQAGGAVRAAEAGLVAAAQKGDEPAIAELEGELRHAEGVRASVLRRIALLETAARALEAEGDAIRRGDRVRALQAQRSGLDAKFCEAEEFLSANLQAVCVAFSRIEQIYEEHRGCGRDLEHLGEKPDSDSRAYGPWFGAPPHPHGVRIVERAFALAAERLGAAGPMGVPVAIHVPFFPATGAQQ